MTTWSWDPITCSGSNNLTLDAKSFDFCGKFLRFAWSKQQFQRYWHVNPSTLSYCMIHKGDMSQMVDLENLARFLN